MAIDTECNLNHNNGRYNLPLRKRVCREWLVVGSKVLAASPSSPGLSEDFASPVGTADDGHDQSGQYRHLHTLRWKDDEGLLVAEGGG